MKKLAIVLLAVSLFVAFMQQSIASEGVALMTFDEVVLTFQEISEPLDEYTTAYMESRVRFVACDTGAKEVLDSLGMSAIWLYSFSDGTSITIATDKLSCGKDGEWI